MDVRSLGFRTDLMLRRLGGSRVEDRGDHLVVRTPHNPTFYWGNFLLYPEPPHGDDAEEWLRAFAAELPEATHVAIGVDGTGGELGDCDGLRGAGLSAEVNTVLVADDVASSQPPGGVVLRPLDADGDWQQAVELQLAVETDDSAEQREFVTRRMREYAGLTRTGRGVHVGAFADGVVRAALGLYTEGGGLGRYQVVETHPDFRRRGFAGALLGLAARLGRDRLGIERFVIVADPDYVAIDLYRRLGFADAERQVQWQRAPVASNA